MRYLLITLLMVVGMVVSGKAISAPHHFDTHTHVCVETRWDSWNGREYCSIYEARRPIYRPVPSVNLFTTPSVNLHYSRGNVRIHYDSRTYVPNHYHRHPRHKPHVEHHHHHRHNRGHLH